MYISKFLFEKLENFDYKNANKAKKLNAMQNYFSLIFKYIIINKIKKKYINSLQYFSTLFYNEFNKISRFSVSESENIYISNGMLKFNFSYPRIHINVESFGTFRKAFC